MTHGYYSFCSVFSFPFAAIAYSTIYNARVDFRRSAQTWNYTNHANCNCITKLLLFPYFRLCGERWRCEKEEEEEIEVEEKTRILKYIFPREFQELIYSFARHRSPLLSPSDCNSENFMLALENWAKCKLVCAETFSSGIFFKTKMSQQR